jgi:mono/diheme cytochrome c family protein
MRRLAVLITLLTLGGCESLNTGAEVMSAGIHAASQAPDVSAVQRGAAYAQANCASCHSIGQAGESRLAGAPPFRMLGLRYPIEDLAEAFAEGIITAHPAMPEFVMSSEENSDLIAYLQSIQSPADH